MSEEQQTLATVAANCVMYRMTRAYGLNPLLQLSHVVNSSFSTVLERYTRVSSPNFLFLSCHWHLAHV